MDAARELFKRLANLERVDESGRSPQQQLLHYCTDVLGSIERYHVDFKQKHDRSDSRLADDDRKNLAKAVSGFANSGGGVLIWGIEDKTMSPKPIADVPSFVSSLLELAPQVTAPTAPDIDGHWIPSDTESEREGFGLILVPESLLPPHRVILSHRGTKNHYFVRSGQSFEVASHTQLEDMFGRRPKPVLALSTKFEIRSQSGSVCELCVMLGIENRGRGVAKSPFLSVTVHQPYHIDPYGIDGCGGFGLRELSSALRSGERQYGSSANDVIHSGVTHDVTAVSMKVDVEQSAPGVQDLVLDYRIAAEGTRLLEDRRVIQGWSLFGELLRQLRTA